MIMERKYRHDMGEGGNCICPKCGERMAHKRNIPCQDEKCSKCGSKMLREGSYHHELLIKKQDKNKKQDWSRQNRKSQVDIHGITPVALSKTFYSRHDLTKCGGYGKYDALWILFFLSEQQAWKATGYFQKKPKCFNHSLSQHYNAEYDRISTIDWQMT